MFSDLESQECPFQETLASVLNSKHSDAGGIQEKIGPLFVRLALIGTERGIGLSGLRSPLQPHYSRILGFEVPYVCGLQIELGMHEGPVSLPASSSSRGETPD